MFDRRTFLKTGAACAAFTLAGARAQFAHAALPDDRRYKHRDAGKTLHIDFCNSISAREG